MTMSPQPPSPSPTLLECWLEIVRPWTVVFAQRRTFLRAVRQGLGSLLCLGRSTLSRIIWTTGREQNSWSGEYFLHSRAPWNPHALFEPMVREALQYCPGRLVGVAVDDTRLKKTGRSIPQAQYHRDPLSPPFHVNLIWALRFLQASLLLPLHRSGPWSARGVPIRFEEVSSVKKPGRGAGEEAWKIYKQEVKERNLSRRFVRSTAELRETFDRAGAQKKVLVIVGDGSFCNRTVLAGIPDRVVLIARTRKDASLCFRAPEGDRRFYSQDKFTPDQARLDESIPWQTTKIFYGGKRRTVRYKEVTGVLWQGGARKRPLRLFVIAATPYRKRKSGKLCYHHPAFLLTTMPEGSTRQLLQMYFDRWQIEINHRDEKDTLGVGQAQVWNPVSVPKQPALVVASYSALLLAALKAFGPGRGEAYAKLPKWRSSAKRPSCLDLATLLRKEAEQNPQLLEALGFQISSTHLVAAAAA
jgi:DDE superfamily endonuclease